MDTTARSYHFEVHTGIPEDRSRITAGTKNGRGGFRCLLTDAPIPFEYIRNEGQRGRLGFVMIAIVAELPRGRLYLPPSKEHIDVASSAIPSDYPDTDLPEAALGFRVQNYGIRKHWQMFIPRQLTAMVALSDLIKNICAEIRHDAAVRDLSADDAALYARTVSTFLALAMDRCVDFNNSLCGWSASNQKVMHLFGRQAIPMIWDFAEANILAGSVGAWSTCSEYVADCVEVLTAAANGGCARQIEAATGANGIANLLVSTDPPYYDNIGYAALSDVFYVWLRRTIGPEYRELFSTVLVPKIPELTASPELFGGDKEKAKEHFEIGFRNALTALRDKMDPQFPLTVYYAFKQDDEESGADEEVGSASSVDLTTGWETLLDALIASGFQITGTWPVRASQARRMRAMAANA